MRRHTDTECIAPASAYPKRRLLAAGHREWSDNCGASALSSRCSLNNSRCSTCASRDQGISRQLVTTAIAAPAHRSPTVPGAADWCLMVARPSLTTLDESPKPLVGGSIPSGPASFRQTHGCGGRLTRVGSRGQEDRQRLVTHPTLPELRGLGPTISAATSNHQGDTKPFGSQGERHAEGLTARAR